jgi:hypothetical protein
MARAEAKPKVGTPKEVPFLWPNMANMGYIMIYHDTSIS